MKEEQLNVKCSCGEDLVTCEECETRGCPECNEGWCNDWYQDESGIWFCPECITKMKKEWNESTNNGTKICCKCSMWSEDEGFENYGFCKLHKEDRDGCEYCSDWKQPQTTVTFQG